MKTCTKCGEAKPDDHFALRRRGGTKRCSECRDCAAARMRATRAAKREGTYVPGRTAPEPTGVKRTCSRCKRRLDSSRFDRDRYRADGRHSQCKTCRAAHNAKYLTEGSAA